MKTTSNHRRSQEQQKQTKRQPEERRQQKPKNGEPEQRRQQQDKGQPDKGRPEQQKKGQPDQQQQQQLQPHVSMRKRVEATLRRLEQKDPGLAQLLKEAHGYAVFPSVGKASLVVGGAYGRGAVFDHGKMIGYATIAQTTLGVQIGGDTFTEVIVFHDKGSLDRFRSGHMAFVANASAVLIKAAAAATNNFRGVTTRAYSSGGMLLELVIGGQKFNFKPLGDESGAEAGGEADEAGGGGGITDMLGHAAGAARRALGGARDAASKATDLAKEHPVAATLIGAGIASGLTFLAVRAWRQAQDASGQQDETSDDDQSDYDDADDADDEGQADEAEQDDDDEDQDNEGEGDEEDEGDDEDATLSRRGRARA